MRWEGQQKKKKQRRLEAIHTMEEELFPGSIPQAPNCTGLNSLKGNKTRKKEK